MNKEIERRIVSGIGGDLRSETERLLRRASLQIQFAKLFAEKFSEGRQEDWKARIAEAESAMAGVDPAGGVAELDAAVTAAETAMAEIGNAAKEYNIHCVGHGHIDMNWMWSWPETVSLTHDTFASVLLLMRQYPDFIYSQSQGAVYAIMEKYFPDVFEEIVARVKEGRWEVTAAQWVEGDKNLASGESICRHLLYTRDFFKTRMGLEPEDMPVEWEPDTFGHANTIPEIISQGAVKFYYSWRQGGGFDHALVGERRPYLYYWEGPDGSRVLVNREIFCYNTYFAVGENIVLPAMEAMALTGFKDTLKMFGVGNHGGAPSRAELDYYHELQALPVYPSLVFSTTKKYFESIEAAAKDRGEGSIPVIPGEANFEFTGCYTSQSLIKQANRYGENFLEEAETLAAIATQLGGRKYPTEQLREAWLKVLFTQFHDILPGSGVRQTREHAMSEFQEVGAITGAIKRSAAKTLTESINTLALLPDTLDGREERAAALDSNTEMEWEAGAGLRSGLSGLSQSRGGGRRFRPYVLYNPCAFSRSGRVVIDLYDSGFAPESIVAVDEEGVAHPVLVLEREGEVFAWGHNRISVTFVAHDVPALGYRTYMLCEGEATVSDGKVDATRQNCFETPHFKMQIDRDRGGINSLIDKRTGAELVKPGEILGGWAFVMERPSDMSAWGLGQEIVPPVPLVASGFHVIGRDYDGLVGRVLGGGPAGIRVFWTLTVPGTRSSVAVSLFVDGAAPRLDFDATLHWEEIGAADRGAPGLTVRFPLAMSNIESLYETPFGSIARDLDSGEEVPTLRYAHLAGSVATPSGDKAAMGLTLLQDCKYGHSLHGDELRLRIVRSSCFPDPLPEVAESTMRYSLYLNEGAVDPAEATRLGAAWNHPLIVLPAGLHEGAAKARRSFVSVSSLNVVVSAVKQAEDGNGLIVRLVELNGQATEATVELDSEFTEGFDSASTVDLMERPAGAQCHWDASGDVNRFTVSIAANSFVSVRLAKGSS